jgi:pyruvate formate lyase activating enzyme
VDFIANLDKSIPWHISAFTPKYKMLDVPDTSDERLLTAQNIGKKAGLEYVYVGNTFNSKGQITYCPECNELLIERDWGYVKIKNLVEGHCGKCKKAIPGVWS